MDKKTKVIIAEDHQLFREGLKAMLNSPDLVVVDVRTGSDWSSSEFKIKGAVRVEPSEVASWADARGKDKIYVLYCA